jgi:hypothetical protein
MTVICHRASQEQSEKRPTYRPLSEHFIDSSLVGFPTNNGNVSVAGLFIFQTSREGF